MQISKESLGNNWGSEGIITNYLRVDKVHLHVNGSSDMNPVDQSMHKQQQWQIQMVTQCAPLPPISVQIRHSSVLSSTSEMTMGPVFFAIACVSYIDFSVNGQ